MKRILVWLLIALMLMLTSSCTTTEGNNMNQTWTQNQLNVLGSTLIAQERIDDGKLLPSEVRLMNIVAKVEDYLAQRYPGETFVIHGLKDVLFQSDRLSMRVSDSAGASFHMVTNTAKEDLSDLAITDGYYPLVKDAQAKEYVLDLLEDAGMAGGKTTAWLYGSFDAAYDPALSMTESIAQGLGYGVFGNVFLPKAGNENVTADSLTAALCGKGLTGSLSVWVMDMLPEGEPAAAWVKEYCKPQGACAIHIDLE